MEKSLLIQEKVKKNFLKNMIKNMNAMELIEIYSETSEEVSYYKRKKEEFFELWHANKLNEIRSPYGKDDDYYIRWILDSVENINTNDKWLIPKDGWWAKVKSLDRSESIKDLWQQGKYSYSSQKAGYDEGFLAINIDTKTIIDVGTYSDDEENYLLTTMKI